MEDDKKPLPEEKGDPKAGKPDDNKKPEHKRRRRRRGKKPPKDDNVPSHNDWSFYALNEDIAKSIGNLPYNVLSGIPFTLEYRTSPTSGSINSRDEQTSPATVMVLNYVNTPGAATKATDGINIAASQLYTFVRHANSGAKNYEAPDMMMYVLAFRDIYAHFFECKRILGLAGTYTFLNKALPKQLLYTLGVDTADLQTNYATYRGRLNILVEKINAWAVPKYFKAFERAAYISSYVFADSTTIRGQMYAFRRLSYYVWSGTESETGTQLTAKSMPAVGSTPPKFSQYLDILEEMLDAVAYDDDAHTMSGDILRAFPESELYQLAGVPEGYTLVPTMDEDILAQIENSYAVESYFPAVANAIVSGANLNINQENQLITFKPTWTYKRGTGEMREVVLNSHKDQPDYKDTLEWTRMMSMPVLQSNNNTNATVNVTCGLELLVSYSFYTTSASLGADENPQGTLVTNASNGNAAATDMSFATMAAVEQFDWHPFIYKVNAGRVYIYGDLRYYTVVNNESVKQIHDSAVAAAFYGGDLYRKGSNQK